MSRYEPLAANRGLFFSFPDILPECNHIVLKGFRSRRSDLAGGAGHLALEALLDGDVARRVELVDLHAEVARGGAGLFLEVGEVRLVGLGQDGNHRQPQFGVQEWV